MNRHLTHTWEIQRTRHGGRLDSTSEAADDAQNSARTPHLGRGCECFPWVIHGPGVAKSWLGDCLALKWPMDLDWRSWQWATRLLGAEEGVRGWYSSLDNSDTGHHRLREVAKKPIHVQRERNIYEAQRMKTHLITQHHLVSVISFLLSPIHSE